MEQGAATIAIVALGAAGVGFTLANMGTEIAAMEGQHWIMLFVAVVVGYVLGRLWTQPAQMLGLP